MTDDSRRAVWNAAEQAREDGWEMEMSDRGHLLLRAPQGGSMVLTAVAAAHHRTAGNVRALLRRYGSQDA